VPPGHAEAGAARRLERHRMRTLLNEISSVRRTQRCGRFTVGDMATVRMLDGVAHWEGVETCAKVWGCPVCATKILARRADDATLAVVRHLGEDGAGGFGYFLTLTIQHTRRDSLATTIEVLTTAIRALWTDQLVKRQRKALGVIGQIRSIEITHGEASWHPHAHFVLFTERELDPVELLGLFCTLDAAWASTLIGLGWPEGKPGIRVDLVPVYAGGVGAYLCKDGMPASVGNELGRGDLKSGRNGSRTFFQIVADFGTDGRAADLDLIHEHEAATAGKSRVRWSPRLRARLIPEAAELTNEEIMAERRGGDATVHMLPATYRRVARIPGGTAYVMTAAELAGFEGVLRLLVAWQLSPRGIVTPAEYVTGRRTDEIEESDE
jgi:replication protein